MPFSFSVRPKHNFVHVVAEGHLTIGDTLRCTRQYLQHPDFTPDADILIDIAGVVSNPFERDESIDEALLDRLTLSSRDVRQGAACRVACVGGTEANQTLFVAASKMVNPTAEVRAFDAMRKAREWLEEAEVLRS